jgi:hypothetical protein
MSLFNTIPWKTIASFMPTVMELVRDAKGGDKGLIHVASYAVARRLVADLGLRAPREEHLRGCKASRACAAVRANRMA